MTTTMSRKNDLEPGQWASAALALADRLVAEAIWAGNVACTFAGAGSPLAEGEPAPYSTIGAGAYDGTAGVARFLYRADRYAPGHYRPTAAAALRHAVTTTQGFSLFSGSLGVAVIALESGDAEFTNQAALLIDESIAEARSLGDHAPADLLAGLAGVVVGLDAALNHTPPGPEYARWANAMVEFGTTLHRTGTARHGGLSWPVYPDSSDHLCGLAHGASGVAYAMQLLEQRAPHMGSWPAVASAARSWERLHFSQAQGSWADLRSDNNTVDEAGVAEPECPHMWCHGSIGIAAERLTADASDRFAALDLIAAIEALQFSTQATIDAPRGAQGSHVNNGSQCHGLSGSIDALIDIALTTGQPEPFMNLAHQAAAAMQCDAEQLGTWRCGIPKAAKTPGLMIGLAGIGWALLRLADPTHVPSAWRLGSWPGKQIGQDGRQAATTNALIHYPSAGDDASDYCQ